MSHPPSPDPTEPAVTESGDGTEPARPDPGPAGPGRGVRSEVEPREADDVHRAAETVEHLERHRRDGPASL